MLPLVPVTRPQANICRTTTNIRQTYKPQLTSSSVGLAQARPNKVIHPSWCLFLQSTNSETGTITAHHILTATYSSSSRVLFCNKAWDNSTIESSVIPQFWRLKEKRNKCHICTHDPIHSSSNIHSVSGNDQEMRTQHWLWRY